MRKLFFLTIILLSLLFKAQTNRFYYELKYRKDSTETYRSSIMILDVNPKTIKFYDKDLLDYDSINKNNAGGFISRTNTKTDQLIIRKPNTYNNSWYRDFFEYFIINSTDEMKWRLYPITKNYNGYILQKATTIFGGRKWTAWFSKEIEISEGPYKFRGLPGLIFILTDDNNDFSYSLIKNKKLKITYETENFLENHYDKKPIKITTENFNKYIIDLYDNPLRNILESMKNGNKVSLKDREIQSIEELNQKKKMMQKMIKDRYIFIEKDTAPIFK